MAFYHLTAVANQEAILRDGIKADEEGFIYLFDDMLAANPIARGQVFVKRYVVFSVDDAGLTDEPSKDVVGEFSQGMQWRIKQERIESRFLTVVGEFDTVYDKPTEFDYMLGELLGQSREHTDKMFADSVDFRGNRS